MRNNKLVRGIEHTRRILDRENDRAMELVNAKTGADKKYWLGYSAGLESASRELDATVRYLREVLQ